jgi:hypothetical protein
VEFIAIEVLTFQVFTISVIPHDPALFRPEGYIIREFGLLVPINPSNEFRIKLVGF